MWFKNKKKTGYKTVCEVWWPFDLKNANIVCVDYYTQRKIKKSLETHTLKY